LIFVGVLFTLLLIFEPRVTTTTTNYDFTQFLSAVQHNDVKTASINTTGGITGTLSDGKSYTSQIPTALSDNSLTSTLVDHHVQITGVSATTSGLTWILYFLPTLIFIAIFVWIGRQSRRALSGGGGLGGLMGIGASRAKVYDEERPSTRFSDVAGYEGAKQEIAEVVDFLREPEHYARAGAVGPRGVLMIGPPGTGKTLLARAVAGEAGVPFFALTGSSFVEMFVGVGASRVRDLFNDARKRAPAIIFIDEIDAIGQRRGGGLVTNDEREQTLNQMLAEMDGFDPATGIVVLGATNRPETLDPALLRPGRFDRQVVIPLPNQAERLAILKVHARGKHIAHDVDFEVNARATPGFSGADLANLLNEAAIVAVRHGRTEIHQRDLDEARDRVTIGRSEATNALLPDERHSVAVHESGHALVAALSDHADPVSKVTILPAGQTLGNTQILPADERHLYPLSYLTDSLAVRLGGRAAEMVVFGEPSTGAASDLAGATELALHMVRDYGMSQRLGPVGFSSGSPAYLGTEEIRSRPYAEGTQLLIDEEIERLLREAEERATGLLQDHRAQLERLADLLVEHETVEGSVVYEIAGRPVPRGPAQPVAPRSAAAAPVAAGAAHGSSLAAATASPLPEADLPPQPAPSKGGQHRRDGSQSSGSTGSGSTGSGSTGSGSTGSGSTGSGSTGSGRKD
jgi:cell division protease FtsH